MTITKESSFRVTEYDDNQIESRRRKTLCIAVVIGSVIGITMVYQPGSSVLDATNRHFIPDSHHHRSPLLFPASAMFEGKKRPYNPESDFKNGLGNIPPYWESIQRQYGDENNTTATVIVKETTEEKEKNSHADIFWGPCYSPNPSTFSINTIRWEDILAKNRRGKIQYPKYAEPIGGLRKKAEVEVPFGLCRPGFIIIGQGKCGTSSLYHYLVGHPRVLSASKKQIHYFKYHTDESMKWYLSHFPSAETFLSRGALITGEASPGYLPYPDVARRMSHGLEGHTKIIVIVREPLDRAWSSYKYNYVEPALERLKRSGLKGYVKSHLSEEYYRKHHIFSFEDLLRAELNTLRECLKPGGFGETMSRKFFGHTTTFEDEFNRRDADDTLEPLVDLDEYCYGGRVSKNVPREQWSELIADHPEKIINLPTTKLIQSILGRGLYTLPLEWWYASFSANDIYMFCNEDLRERPVESMSDLSGFLGLPTFNFTNVVSKGMYNVGGNEGYDKPTSWDEVEEVHESESLFLDKKDTSGSTSVNDIWSDIPISAELLQEFIEFVKPYNDRLFQLTGKRCPWNY